MSAVTTSVVAASFFYHLAQIEWDMIQMALSLSSQTIKTKIMAPFKAPGNLLHIESNRWSLALFILKLRTLKWGWQKMSGENGLKKDTSKFKSLSGINSNAQDDLPLLKSTKKGVESKSLVCRISEKNGP